MDERSRQVAGDVRWPGRAALLGLPLAILFVGSSLRAQESTRWSPAAAREVVERLADLVEEHYVLPDVAEECAERLRTKLEDGRYATLRDPNQMATALTRDLREVSEDLHFRVSFRPRTKAAVEKTLFDSAAELLSGDGSRRNHGFLKVELLRDNIGYLELSGFADGPAAFQTAGAALAFLSNAEAIVIDLRKNGGGSPQMVRFLASYFLPEETHLNTFYDSKFEILNELWTMDSVPGKRMLDTPLYLLTSRRTGSAGEAFPYHLQAYERGVVVGEVTAGAANPGTTFDVGHGLMAFISDGQVVNPVTETNWEETGVQPDVAASDLTALKVALDLAGKEVTRMRREAEQRLRTLLKETEEAFQKAAQEWANDQEGSARDTLHSCMTRGLASGLLGEDIFNRAGIRLMEQDQSELSRLVLEIVVQEFPHSANARASLGEAHARLGQWKQAHECFAKAVEFAEEALDDERLLGVFQKNLQRAEEELKAQSR